VGHLDRTARTQHTCSDSPRSFQACGTQRNEDLQHAICIYFLGFVLVRHRPRGKKKENTSTAAADREL
jgi:hypothetical protein